MGTGNYEKLYTTRSWEETAERIVLCSPSNKDDLKAFV